MNITFLIGNGFDVGMGMKSRFSDFFPKYCADSIDKEAVSNAVIGKTIIRCPRCGSQSITTGQRGYNIVFGFGVAAKP